MEAARLAPRRQQYLREAARRLSSTGALPTRSLSRAAWSRSIPRRKTRSSGSDRQGHRRGTLPAPVKRRLPCGRPKRPRGRRESAAGPVGARADAGRSRTPQPSDSLLPPLPAPDLIPLLTGLGLAVRGGSQRWAVLSSSTASTGFCPRSSPGRRPRSSRARSSSARARDVPAEFVADKIPLADRFWEAAHTLLRPVIGGAARAGVRRRVVAAGAGRRGAGRRPRRSGARSPSPRAADLDGGHARFDAVRAVDGGGRGRGGPRGASVLPAVVHRRRFSRALTICSLIHGPRVRRRPDVLFFRIQHPAASAKSAVG